MKMRNLWRFPRKILDDFRGFAVVVVTFLDEIFDDFHVFFLGGMCFSPKKNNNPISWSPFFCGRVTIFIHTNTHFTDENQRFWLFRINNHSTWKPPHVVKAQSTLQLLQDDNRRRYPPRHTWFHEPLERTTTLARCDGQNDKTEWMRPFWCVHESEYKRVEQLDRCPSADLEGHRLNPAELRTPISATHEKLPSRSEGEWWSDRGLDIFLMRCVRLAEAPASSKTGGYRIRRHVGSKDVNFWKLKERNSREKRRWQFWTSWMQHRDCTSHPKDQIRHRARCGEPSCMAGFVELVRPSGPPSCTDRQGLPWPHRRTRNLCGPAAKAHLHTGDLRTMRVIFVWSMDIVEAEFQHMLDY